jgi:hypothetical protein
LKIGSAFPRILERRYPLVRPEYPLLTILYLLRMKEVDAVPITYADEKKNRAVFGFSSLPRFMALGPRHFGSLLNEPCEDVSEDLAYLGVDEDLESLLDAFGSRRLGFALVHGVGKDRDRRSLVSLTDVLGLYLRKVIRARMKVEEVSTPTFSMPGSASIRSALGEMFRHRYRRVFVSGREFVSDRSVLSYVFSPVSLDRLGQDRDVLSTPIDSLEMTSAITVSPGTSLMTAALKLRVDRGQCLLMSGGRVATPWDIVMKPWQSGKLAVGQR